MTDPEREALREAAQAVLDAEDSIGEEATDDNAVALDKALFDLRAALSPGPEPVACPHCNGEPMSPDCAMCGGSGVEPGPEPVADAGRLRAICEAECTSGCHSDDCEHHDHLPASDIALRNRVAVVAADLYEQADFTDGDAARAYNDAYARVRAALYGRAALSPGPEPVAQKHWGRRWNDGLTEAEPEPVAGLDFIAQAEHIRAEHEATHGEAEQCGGECIVLGLCDEPVAGLDVERLLDEAEKVHVTAADAAGGARLILDWVRFRAREYAALGEKS